MDGALTCSRSTIRQPREKVGASTRDAEQGLETHPLIGRTGTVAGTREKLALPYPYVIVYEVDETRDEVRILRIYQMAQDRSGEQPDEGGEP